MKNILNKLSDYWFQAMPPERLAMLRIATGFMSLWYLVDRFGMMMDIVKSGSDNFEPIGILSFMSAPMPAEWFQMFLLGTILFNILYILGVKFKAVGPIFACMLMLLMTYRNSWSMIYHNYNGLTLHIFVIGLAASADALSFDAWRTRGKNWLKQGTSSWLYGTPVIVICVATVITYALSGLAKVWSELAWDWAQGTAMRSQVASDSIRKIMLGGESEVLFGWLFEHTWVFMGMGILTFVLELGAPLALINRKLAYSWVVLTLGMHWGIYFIMGIDFPYQLSGFVFLSFLPIENLLRLKRNEQGSNDNLLDNPTQHSMQPQAIVLFDGVCNFCNNTVRFIIDRDKSQRFHFTSIQSSKGAELLAQYNAPSDLSTIVLIENGKVYVRSSAVLRIARHMTFPYSLAYIFILTPSVFRDFFYKKFAERRYQWFGQKEVCEIPPVAIRARFLD